MPGRGGRGGGSGGRGGIVSSLSRGIASGIGLVSESMSSSKDKKPQQQQQPQPDYHQHSQSQSHHHQSTPSNSSSSEAPPPPYSRTPEPENDATEEYWHLDDVQQEVTPNSREDFRTALNRQPHPHGPIELPVILPQRRPKDRTRGFVRGYAPVLQNADIDESLWFGFLDELETASHGSAWFHTVNVAALSAMALPMGWSQLVAITVHKMVGSAQEIDARRKGNTFINDMNKQLFMPRGLFCLLMTWKPQVKDTHPTIDLNDTINGVITSDNHGFGNSLREADGQTHGDFPVPEAAPLIFPALDRALENPDDPRGKSSGFKDKYRSKMDFVSDYYDRRAQAIYAGQNPDSMLSNQTEAPEFSSRWADPNSAANNGYLSGVLTGGMIDRSSSKMAQKQQQKHEQDSESSRGGRGGRGGGRGGRGGGGGRVGRGDSSSGGGDMMESHRERRPVQEDWSMGNVMSSPVKSLAAAPRAAANMLVSKPRQARKKALKPDVLYLMVVNMPSQDLINESARYA